MAWRGSHIMEQRNGKKATATPSVDIAAGVVRQGGAEDYYARCAAGVAVPDKRVTVTLPTAIKLRAAWTSSACHRSRAIYLVPNYNFWHFTFPRMS